MLDWTKSPDWGWQPTLRHFGIDWDHRGAKRFWQVPARWKQILLAQGPQQQLRYLSISRGGGVGVGFVRQNPDYHLVLTCNSIGRVLFPRLRLSLPPKDRHLNAYSIPLSSLAAFDLLCYFRLSKLSISFSLPSRSRFTYQNDMAPKFPVVQSTKKPIKLWFVSTRVQPWPQEWYVQS